MLHTPTSPNYAIRPIYPDGHLDLIPADITSVNVMLGLMALSTGNCCLPACCAKTKKPSTARSNAGGYCPATSVLTNALMLACKELLAVVMLNGSSVKALRVLESNVVEINAAIENLNMRHPYCS